MFDINVFKKLSLCDMLAHLIQAATLAQEAFCTQTPHPGDSPTSGAEDVANAS